MKPFMRMSVAMVLFGIAVWTIPVMMGAGDESAYPWKSGEPFVYRNQDEEHQYNETCTLKKVKKKKAYIEHEFKYEVEVAGISFNGGFELDEKGVFHACSGMIRTKQEASMILRFSATRKDSEIKISSAWRDEAGRGPKSVFSYNGIPDDTWVFMNGTTGLALYLSRENLALEYDQIKQFILLNPMSEERRAGKIHLAVTGEESIDFNGTSTPVFKVQLDVPKFTFTMNPDDQNQVAVIHCWVSKADGKLLKLVSDDLKSQSELVP